jgi:toxin ParE1/3/4
MSATITKTPQARRDLLQLADYIARDSLDTAERFLDAAETAFYLLADMPEMGTRCEFSDPEAADVRMWSIRGFENHVVFYRPLQDGIDVVRVIQGSRDIQNVFRDDVAE